MMPRSRRTLAQQAMLKSIEVRKAHDLPLNAPLDIYALCEKVDISVRFVPFNMEGVYLAGKRPRILLSALRPLVRRNFTCGHELGHHVFGHGFTIDELADDSAARHVAPEEFLVQAFAGFFLMPALAVRKAFATRGWRSTEASPVQLYSVACSFGLGYATLVNHLAYSLDMLSPERAAQVLKLPAARVRRELLGQASSSPLIVVDEHWSLPTVDAEVGTQLLLPPSAEVEGDVMSHQADLSAGQLFAAERPGLAQVHCPDVGLAAFVRISRYQYVGLAQYRHLEVADDDRDDE